MKIIIRNNTNIPKKYIRLIRTKMSRLKNKFHHLVYAEVFLKEEGKGNKQYQANIRLGIPGNDLIIRNQSGDLPKLLQRMNQDSQRYLSENKSFSR